MNDYYKIRINFSPVNSDITDLAAAYLGEVGFESFEPDESGLFAYINTALGEGEKLAHEVLNDFPIETEFTITQEFVKGQNWNEEWEKNYFKPILIDNACVIHSSFHKDVPKAEYDIVIDPKMAFGTGHHDTTSNMVRHILNENLHNKLIIDMGTGTGILGILASLRGAKEVIGIEIDLPAYENALENVSLNKVNMNLIHGDASALEGLKKADILFANINRNIILADISKYARALNENGVMMLSGFYEEDIPLILSAAREYNFEETSRKVSDTGWSALRLQRSTNQKSL